MRMQQHQRRAQRRHPEVRLPPVPDLRDGEPSLVAGQPILWRPAPGASDAAPVLERHSADVRRDAQVIVVANPFCHFAQAAVAALDGDRELGPLLAARSTWLTPQDGFFAVDDAVAWNRAHPRLPIAFSARREDWPFVDDWSSPTFYFLRQGKLVAKVTGWPTRGPAVGRRDEVRAALHQLGLR